MLSFHHHSLLIPILAFGPSLLFGVKASAIPRETPNFFPAKEHPPRITPSPALWDPTKTEKVRRNLLDDLQSKANEEIGVVQSRLGNVPSHLESGIPDIFEGFPTGDKVQSSLGIDDDQIAALPTQVINIP